MVDSDSLRSVKSSLEKVVKQLGSPAAIISVQRLWPEIVDPDLAEHCTPVSLRAGRLLVSATDSNWATELRYRGGHIVEQLTEQLGSGVVMQIDVSVKRL